MTKKPRYIVDGKVYNIDFYRDNWVSDAYKVVIYCEDCGSTSKEDHEDKVFNNECKEHKN